MPYELLDEPKGRYEMLPPDTKPETTLTQDIKQGIGNVLAGGVRGAGSIGATLMAPVDILNDAIAGKGLSLESNRQRRADMDSALQEMGAEPDSLLYKGSKLGTEVLGTLGVGGALARPVAALANTKYASGLEPLIEGAAQAVRTGGFRAGPLAGTKAGALARVLGGATTGGASAALVDPKDAGPGALVGGAFPIATKLAGETGRLIGSGVSSLAKNTLGMTTGAGAETIGTAYKAGKEGSTSFLENMRGMVPMTDVLDSAKEALSKMRVDRGNEYRSGMIDITKDKSVIPFAPIENAVKSLQNMGSFKGQVINKNASGTVQEISDLVNQWKSLPANEYHTPEGLDALKKAIGDIRDATQFGSPGRRAADTAYNAVKEQINTQAPTYAKVMGNYSQASDLIKDIERTLSQSPNASIDTSMRKLQSLMRNNVNTNYGNRLALAKKLEENGADILPAVAGQAASSWTPRGLQGLAATGAGFASLANPATLAALPLTSPRLMGEAAYGLGALNRGAGNLVEKAKPQKLAELLKNLEMQSAPSRALPVFISGLQTQ